MVKFRIKRIEVFGIQMIRNDSKAFAESLIVDDFSLTKKFDRLPNVGIIGKTENIVISGAGLLLCCHVFVDISDSIPFGL